MYELSWHTVLDFVTWSLFSPEPFTASRSQKKVFSQLLSHCKERDQSIHKLVFSILSDHEVLLSCRISCRSYPRAGPPFQSSSNSIYFQCPSARYVKLWHKLPPIPMRSRCIVLFLFFSVVKILSTDSNSLFWSRLGNFRIYFVFNQICIWKK